MIGLFVFCVRFAYSVSSIAYARLSFSKLRYPDFKLISVLCLILVPAANSLIVLCFKTFRIFAISAIPVSIFSKKNTSISDYTLVELYHIFIYCSHGESEKNERGDVSE